MRGPRSDMTSVRPDWAETCRSTVEQLEIHPVPTRPTMDETRYTIRDFVDSDYPAFADLHKAVDPSFPVSPESLRHRYETLRLVSGPLPRFVVSDRHTKEVVGVGGLVRHAHENDAVHPWIYGEVLPARQRQGIGSYLYRVLLAEALRRGAQGLRCTVEENSAAGRTFLAKRAFVERRRTWQSRLEVAAAETSELEGLIQGLSHEGVEFTSLAREGANDPLVLHRIHDLDIDSGRDVPRVGAYTPISFEVFRRFLAEDENVVPEAWLLAKAGNRYIGMSSAGREPAKPGILQQYFTGTRAEYRRKKVALTLKMLLIQFARENGYVGIETFNDASNAPMWMLNQRLGFRKLRELIQVECDLRGMTPE